MKKLLLLTFIISTFSYSQITDENGNKAASATNTDLEGNIGIGTNAPTEKIEIIGSARISENINISGHIIQRSTNNEGSNLAMQDVLYHPTVWGSWNNVIGAMYISLPKDAINSGRYLMDIEVGQLGFGSHLERFTLSMYRETQLKAHRYFKYGDDYVNRFRLFEDADRYYFVINDETQSLQLKGLKVINATIPGNKVVAHDNWTSGYLADFTGLTQLGRDAVITDDNSSGGGKFVDGTDPLDAVYNGGNVGIGTDVPALAGADKGIHIHGTTAAELKLTGTSSGSDPGDGFALQIAGNNVNFNNREAGSNIFYLNNSEFLRMNSNRRLGIEITNPLAKFEVVNTDPTLDYFRLSSSGGSSGDVLKVDKDGNVGIATINTGTHKLAVEGSIGAREIKVEIGSWSDFVFFKNYNLPTLKEVETHIAEKGHLQDIPSAKEVKENGIFLGDMNAKLLQKIEELTLYTIQQQKELEQQKEKNTSLENRLKKIEQLLKK
jgi:hypothetical protein